MLAWALLAATTASARAPSTWTLVSENDSPWSLLWNKPYRDEYYTNGIRVSRSQWIAGHTERGLGRAAQAAASVLPVGTADVVRLGAAQTMYTPMELWEPTPPPTVHPYAGHLHLTAGFGAVRDGWRTSVEFLGGWTGPKAYGEPAQKLVHDLFHGTPPEGWDHQVAFEPTFGLSLGLAAGDLVRASRSGLEVRLVPAALAVASTTDVAAELGGLMGLGTAGDVPAMRPEEARFGHSGIDGYYRGDTTVGFAVYGFAEVRAVAHDMFVSGGTFTEVPAPESEATISEAGIGATLRLWKTRIIMANNLQSVLYTTQAHRHVYGTISIAQDLGPRPQ